MNQKLKTFLSNFPESAHPLGDVRFLEYALECASSNQSIDVETMRKRGLSEKCIDRLEFAYYWIRLTYEHLHS